MDEQDDADLRMQAARLRLEHEDLKSAIEAMVTLGRDPLAIQRLKKKKLDLKDRLTRLSSSLIPDIRA